MTINYLAALEEQSAAFTTAVSQDGMLARPVPSCPDWTVADLVEHLGEVQNWWTWVVRAAGEQFDQDAARAAGKPDGDLLDWWLDRSAGLVAALRETAPDTPCWVWWNAERRSTTGDVAWRQAHEALIHGWDAARAAGASTGGMAEPALWADGVDEFIARYLDCGDRPWSGPPGVIVLRAVDAGREWRFGRGAASALDGGRPAPATADQPPSVVVTGRADQLDLLLWRRVEADPEHVDGDADLLAAFLAMPDLN